MALTQIDFDDKEEKIIDEVSKKYNLNKPKSVKKIADCLHNVFAVIISPNVNYESI